MKAIKILKQEHKNILKIVNAMEKECNQIKSGKNINKIFFEKIIWFIKNYADKFHHAKEEDILFKEMNSNFAQGRLQCNPVKQMLYEHEEGRNFVMELKKGLKKNNKKKILENAEKYIQLIKEHIFKEDNILYPMAENAFDNKTKEKILMKMETTNAKKSKEENECLKIIKEIGI